MHLFIVEIETLEIFCDDNDEPVEDFLQGQDELFLKTGTQKLQKWWHECIEVYRDHVEK